MTIFIFMALLCMNNLSTLFASQVPANNTPTTNDLKRKSSQNIVNTSPEKRAKQQQEVHNKKVEPKKVPTRIDAIPAIQNSLTIITAGFTCMLMPPPSTPDSSKPENILQSMYSHKTAHISEAYDAKKALEPLPYPNSRFSTNLRIISEEVRLIQRIIFKNELTTIEPQQDAIKKELTNLADTMQRLISQWSIPNNPPEWAVSSQDVFHQARSRMIGQYELTIRAFEAIDKDFVQEFLPKLAAIQQAHASNIVAMVAAQKKQQESDSMEKVRILFSKAKTKQALLKKQTA